MGLRALFSAASPGPARPLEGRLAHSELSGKTGLVFAKQLKAVGCLAAVDHNFKNGVGRRPLTKSPTRCVWTGQSRQHWRRPECGCP